MYISVVAVSVYIFLEIKIYSMSNAKIHSGKVK